MKWTSILTRKRNETLTLFSVLLMIAMIGYMHKKHLSDLEETVITIYEDRLVAKDYLFDLSRNVADKKTAINSDTDPLGTLTNINHDIMKLIDRYEKTKLTTEESLRWEELKSDIMLSIEFENQMMHNPNSGQWSKIKSHLDDQYELVFNDLKILSDIQLDEGKRLVENSKSVAASNTITSRLEVALLIIVLLVFMMFNSSTKKPIVRDALPG